MGAIALERDGLQTRLADIETETIKRDSEFREVEQIRTTLIDRTAALARAFTAKEAALERAEHTVAALQQQLEALANARAADRLTAEQAIEELKTALQREKLERSVSDGALETARKDFARVAREVMALQRNQASFEATAQPRAANAA
jgi:phosphopantetheinyl transferase (holo-ACP synthase)